MPSNLLLYRLRRITDKYKLTEADISMIATKLCAIHNKNKRIKATDNPSLAFICFVERFVVALLSVYARMPDFANNACK